jgi:hypothetical protein
VDSILLSFDLLVYKVDSILLTFDLLVCIKIYTYIDNLIINQIFLFKLINLFFNY